MNKIIAFSTSTTQWQNLVLESCNSLNIRLSEEIESYLVFLLMRFTQEPHIANKILALDYLNGISQRGNQKSLALRDVGDQCLLYSGLFPEQSRRKRVRLSYFVNMGQSAYQSLSLHDRSSSTSLFGNLAKSFVNLMDIMQTMREIDTHIPSLDPIMAEEIWHDTGSNHALQTLKTFTVCNAPIGTNNPSDIKH